MMVSLYRQLSVGMLVLVLVSGCSSIRSQFVHRDETNTRWQCEHLKGVPITLKVPTHLKVEIVEKTLLTSDGTGAARVIDLPAGTRLRDVRTGFLSTEKIFTVDLDRPAAGTLKYTADFQDQYFTKLQSELEDVTIEETSKAIERILGRVAPQGLLGRPTARNASTEVPVTEIDSVVAASVFEIDAPDFELKLEEFLNTYLNGSCAQVSHQAAM